MCARAHKHTYLYMRSHICISLNESHRFDSIRFELKYNILNQNHKNSRDNPQINFTTSNTAINFLIALIEIISYRSFFSHLTQSLSLSLSMRQYFNSVDCSNFAYSIEFCAFIRYYYFHSFCV